MSDEPCPESEHMDRDNENYKKALKLEYLFVGYNTIEGILAISFGILAGSIALVGFGFDSTVEVLSALILVWRLRVHGKVSEEHEEEIEQKAKRFVAITFFILGIYVIYESANKLWFQEKPDPSPPGLILAMASLIIMPYLGKMKYKLGKAIGSAALVADSKETFVCAILSAALVIGLGLNQALGLWQADPVIGIIISIFLFNEGREMLEDEDEDENEDGVEKEKYTEIEG